MDVEKHCPRGVADIGHVASASRKIPYQPCIHCAETQFSGLCPLPRAGHVVQDPSYLGGAEICVYNQAGLFADESGKSLVLERIAVLGCPPVLPDYGVVYRFTRLGVPYDGGLALVGDADSGNVQAVDAHRCYGLGHHGSLGGPDVLRVMLHPARFREMLREFFLCRCADTSTVVEDNRPGGTGALVKGEYVLLHNYRVLMSLVSVSELFA